jgi:hypothetical protein
LTTGHLLASFKPGHGCKHHLLRFAPLNLLLIVAALLLGRRLIWVCRAAVFISGIALILLLVPLVNLLFATNPPPEYRTAIKLLLTFIMPILVELLVLVGILRWRMCPRWPASAVAQEPEGQSSRRPD